MEPPTMSGFMASDKQLCLKWHSYPKELEVWESLSPQLQGRENCQLAAKGLRTPGFPVQNKHQTSCQCLSEIQTGLPGHIEKLRNDSSL